MKGHKGGMAAFLASLTPALCNPPPPLHEAKDRVYQHTASPLCTWTLLHTPRSWLPDAGTSCPECALSILEKNSCEKQSCRTRWQGWPQMNAVERLLNTLSAHKSLAAPLCLIHSRNCELFRGCGAMHVLTNSTLPQ